MGEGGSNIPAVSITHIILVKKAHDRLWKPNEVLERKVEQANTVQYRPM